MHPMPGDARARGDEHHDKLDRSDGPPTDAGRRDRDAEQRERSTPSDHPRRIGAAQMAAPSTRRWRRAGRFGSSD